MIDRRAFLQSLAVAASGLLIPERKMWALDRTMLAAPTITHFIPTCWDEATLKHIFMHFTLSETNEPYIQAVDTEYWPPFLVPETARFDGFSLRGDLPL